MPQVRIPGSGCVTEADLEHAFAESLANAVRSMALDEGLRADGRGLIDLRPVQCEVGVITRH